MRISFWHTVLITNLVLISGCTGDESAGGVGGAGGGATSSASSTASSSTGSGASVVGTKQSGDCATASAFAQQCTAEGGVLGDGCQDAGCGGPGYSATCYAKPPAPSASEFSCVGVLNCAIGQVCTAVNPLADGCFEHHCEAPPAACAADLTCACLQANPSRMLLGCAADSEGNLTLKTGPF